MRGGALASAFESCPASGSDVQSRFTAKCSPLSKTPRCWCQSTSSLCTPQIKAIPNVLWHKWKLQSSACINQDRNTTSHHTHKQQVGLCDPPPKKKKINKNNKNENKKASASPHLQNAAVVCGPFCYEALHNLSNQISLIQRSSVVHIKVGFIKTSVTKCEVFFLHNCQMQTFIMNKRLC